MIIDPATAEPQNIYKLLIGSVVPRPIAFVSTIDKEGRTNLAPFSFFTVCCANPPMVCFTPAYRHDGTEKDTLRNAEETKEFVVNIVSESFAQQMNTCSADYAPGISEFEKSGLTMLPSDLVKPPRVKESLVHMECKLVQVLHFGKKPTGASLVIGEVIRFHVDDSIIHDFKIDPEKLQAIGRMGGFTYSRTTDRFEIPRPSKPA